MRLGKALERLRVSPSEERLVLTVQEDAHDDEDFDEDSDEDDDFDEGSEEDDHDDDFDGPDIGALDLGTEEPEDDQQTATDTVAQPNVPEDTSQPRDDSLPDEWIANRKRAIEQAIQQLQDEAEAVDDMEPLQAQQLYDALKAAEGEDRESSISSPKVLDRKEGHCDQRKPDEEKEQIHEREEEKDEELEEEEQEKEAPEENGE